MSDVQRIGAIDRMRGLVMIVMASDHAAHFYYRDHVILDTSMIPAWRDPLPVIPFLHRWLSHLCAPTFVFLAGAGIALAGARRSSSEQRAFGRDLLLRGFILLALELVVVSPLWASQIEASVMLQVLYAIGVGMILMSVLRGLSVRTSALLGILLAVGCEALAALPLDGVRTWFITGGFSGGVGVLYPVLPWFSAMLLGHAFGRHLARGGSPIRPLLIGSLVALSVWVVVKLGDGYGNMLMTGVHDSPLRWLQVSKYPPSLAFLGLELGLGGLLLAGLFAHDRGAHRPHARNGLLLVLGQTALFFYVAHILLIEASGRVLTAWGIDPHGGLATNWLVVAVVTGLLWRAGIAFRDLRARHPRSLLRLI